MERFCFFCVKNGKETLNNLTSLDSFISNNGEVENENLNGIKPSSNELFKKFSKFIERYLKDSKGSKKCNFGSEFIDCCDQCAKIVSLICDLYHDLKTVELLINWQLWALNKVMTDADNAPSKSQNYEEYLKKAETNLGINNPFEELLGLRKDFVQKCRGKLLGDYPKLVLSKYSPQNHEENSQLVESLPPSPCLSPALSCVNDENDCSIPENCLLEAALAEEPSPLLDIKTSLEFKKTTEISPPSKPSKLKRKKSLDFKTKHKSRRRNASGTSNTTNLKKLKSKLQKKTVQKYEARRRKETNNDSEAIVQFQKEVKLEMNEDKLDKEQTSKENENAPPSLEDELDSDYEMKNAESDSDTDYSSEGEKLKPKKKKKTDGSNNTQPKRIRRSRVPIKCSYCEGTFTFKPNLRRHILRKHKEKLASAVQDPNICSYSRRCYRYLCPDENCKKIFKQVHFLLQHWRDSHYQKESEDSNPALGTNLVVEILTFGVDPDAKIFKTLDAEVKQPMQYTKIELPPLKPDMEQSICEIESCRRIFYSKEDLQTHRKLHGSFTCASCPDTKTFLPELSIHELKAHGGKNGGGRKVVKCPRCEETFADLSVYIRHHISVHFSLKFEEQTCPICKTYLPYYELNEYNSAGNFYDHLKNGHGLGDPIGEVFRCPEAGCSAYFIGRMGITFHLKVDHQLEKAKLNKFKKERDLQFCEECGKGFRHKAKFDLHILSHTGPQSWTFACEVCGKKCLTEQSLNVHKRVHTQEKPFVCQVCGAKYAHRFNLRIHVNSKHGDSVQDVAKNIKDLIRLQERGRK